MLDRTPWCKNTNSLHMSNAKRCLKLRHAKVQQKGSVLCLIEPRGVKNTNSLPMSNAQRCFKLRHAKVQQKGSVLCLIEPRGVKTPIHYL